MVAYSFKARFAEPIVAGTKGGTIRDDRARHARPGEQVQLYTGMRTKQCRLIARKTCLEVQPIHLNIRRGGVITSTNGLRLGFAAPASLDAFAVFDGFVDWPALCAFWMATHDFAYEYDGMHIRWLPWPTALVS